MKLLLAACLMLIGGSAVADELIVPGHYIYASDVLDVGGTSMQLHHVFGWAGCSGEFHADLYYPMQPNYQGTPIDYRSATAGGQVVCADGITYILNGVTGPVPAAFHQVDFNDMVVTSTPVTGTFARADVFSLARPRSWVVKRRYRVVPDRSLERHQRAIVLSLGRR